MTKIQEPTTPLDYEVEDSLQPVDDNPDELDDCAIVDDLYMIDWNRALDGYQWVQR